ncbi:MAG: DNA-directed RNA polymerase subunit D [Candidatus Thermoplasmatota archaeon]|nr:DNA-directed RNA polymerase subunit D [Candidatus Thermoplasmatota archaeon]
MKVEVLEHEERKLRLLIEGTTTATVNALRRTLMMEVPKLAIEEVTIYDNKSALFDEIIAHRLGLLPIPTDPKMAGAWEAPKVDPGELEPDEEDEAEEDLTTQVLYTLTFEGPGTVYSQDLTPATGEDFHQVADPDVPIVKLGSDQRLMLEATAKMGIGAQHAKWQPVVAAGYREYPTVDIPDGFEVDAKTKQALMDLAPEGAISFDGNKLELVDEVKGHDFLYNAHGRFGLEGLTFGSKEGEFLFKFETDGSLSAKDAFQLAIKHLMDKLKGTEESLGDL